MPQSAVPFNGRGKAHAELKRYHAAVRDFTRAVGLDPKFMAAYQHRAAAYLAIGIFREATDDATLRRSSPRRASRSPVAERPRACRGQEAYFAIEDLNKASRAQARTGRGLC